MRKLNFFGDDLLRRYGRRLQRIPIDLALGCPNREGRYGAGCTFCAEDGSRARHLARSLDPAAQVAAGIAYVRERYRAEAPYIAYFQSFTSTFAPVEKLRELYEQVLAAADFRVVIVGTRPDALPDETVNWLRELAGRYELWVELGVQSANDRTLETIRRGHDFAAAADAVRRLDAAGIAVGAHVILGLPGEGPEDFQRTARRLAELPFRAVKLHQLLILRRTGLARQYADPAFPVKIAPLNEYEYAAAAAAFLRELPDDWQIMRLTADADPAEVIAPHWWMDKSRFLAYFRERFDAGSEDFFPGVETADGSRTLYHPEFRQLFHSRAGAESEALHKFIESSELARRLAEKRRVRLLDVGFGLGVNALAAARCAAAVGGGFLEIVSLELDRRTLDAAAMLHPPETEERRRLDTLRRDGVLRTEFAEIRVVYGDARRTLAELAGPFDAVFQDAFSPDCNPELWTLDWFRAVRRRMAPDGVLVTYSSAYPVRGALLKLGMRVGESRPFGRRRGGTMASPAGEAGEALPEKELGIILRSTAGAPYRDPGLRGARQEIFDRRERLLQRLRAYGVPKWFRF